MLYVYLYLYFYSLSVYGLTLSNNIISDLLRNHQSKFFNFDFMHISNNSLKQNDNIFSSHDRTTLSKVKYICNIE